jgi:hypothetical protein
MEAHGETVILPTQFMEELKALPDNMLNLDAEVHEVCQRSCWNSAGTEQRKAVPV